MTRSRWFADQWADDDPAIVRMREALALRPDITASGRADDRGVAAQSVGDGTAPPDAATRREQIAALVRRIENGDLSAVATLRQLLVENR